MYRYALMTTVDWYGLMTIEEWYGLMTIVDLYGLMTIVDWYGLMINIDCYGLRNIRDKQISFLWAGCQCFIRLGASGNCITWYLPKFFREHTFPKLSKLIQLKLRLRISIRMRQFSLLKIHPFWLSLYNSHGQNVKFKWLRYRNSDNVDPWYCWKWEGVLKC